jgi:hypothetical protein
MVRIVNLVCWDSYWSQAPPTSKLVKANRPLSRLRLRDEREEVEGKPPVMNARLPLTKRQISIYLQSLNWGSYCREGFNRYETRFWDIVPS